MIVDVGFSLSEEKEVKPNICKLVPPIKISGDNLIVSMANGSLTAPYSGDILIKSVDSNELIVFELNPKQKPEYQKPVEVPKPTPLHPTTMPHDYVYLFADRARSKAYGRTRSEYLYYKRERDLSYLVVIRKNGQLRKTHLGSLLNPNSILREALRAFPKGEFFRKDIKISNMPSGLRQGQRIKGALDVLSYEGFLSKTEVKWGKRTVEKYVRTSKTIEHRIS